MTAMYAINVNIWYLNVLNDLMTYVGLMELLETVLIIINNSPLLTICLQMI